MTYASRRDRWCSIFGIVSVVLLFFGTEASSLDTNHMATALKALRFIRQDRDATITAYVKFSGVAVGAFADPSFPAPRVSIYDSRRHPWVHLPPGTKAFDKDPT